MEYTRKEARGDAVDVLKKASRGHSTTSSSESILVQEFNGFSVPGRCKVRRCCSSTFVLQLLYIVMVQIDALLEKPRSADVSNTLLKPVYKFKSPRQTKTIHHNLVLFGCVKSVGCQIIMSHPTCLNYVYV